MKYIDKAHILKCLPSHFLTHTWVRVHQESILTKPNEITWAEPEHRLTVVNLAKDFQVRELICHAGSGAQISAHQQGILYLAYKDTHPYQRLSVPLPQHTLSTRENTASHRHISSAATHPQGFHKWPMSNHWEMFACILKHIKLWRLTWKDL